MDLYLKLIELSEKEEKERKKFNFFPFNFFDYFLIQPYIDNFCSSIISLFFEFLTQKCPLSLNNLFFLSPLYLSLTLSNTHTHTHTHRERERVDHPWMHLQSKWKNWFMQQYFNSRWRLRAHLTFSVEEMKLLCL